MTRSSRTIDAVIVGGGVIGLSLAYELARGGWRVQLVERGQLGREASWAGAGILPPAGRIASTDSYHELARLSDQLYPIWSAQLREQTGIDNGFRRCGGIYLARNDADAEKLRRLVAQWRERGIVAEPLDAQALAAREPALSPGELPLAAHWLPEEAQVRNPRHLKALTAGCAQRGVEICTGTSVEEFIVRDGRVCGIVTSGGSISAAHLCVTSGPWTKTLLARMRVELGIRPVRGQMALLSSPQPLIRAVINEGRRYLVPRPDGRVLVGSTEEDVGFDKRTTAEGIAGLLNFAFGLVPALADFSIEQCWAGLRPGTRDDLPYLGRLPGLENAFVAAGHFRGGLHLSPATAVVMARLMRGEPPGVDLTPFRIERE